MLVKWSAADKTRAEVLHRHSLLTLRANADQNQTTGFTDPGCPSCGAPLSETDSGAARQVAQALNDEATFLLSQMANFAEQAKNRDGFAPEWRPVEQIRRICGGIRRD
jgi:hypothetical protein